MNYPSVCGEISDSRSKPHLWDGDEKDANDGDGVRRFVVNSSNTGIDSLNRPEDISN
jgi:hypothetical protein